MKQGKERRKKGIKYLETAKLLFLFLKKQVVSFHLTLPILQFSTLKLRRSFQQFPAESSTSSVE